MALSCTFNLWSAPQSSPPPLLDPPLRCPNASDSPGSQSHVGSFCSSGPLMNYGHGAPSSKLQARLFVAFVPPFGDGDGIADGIAVGDGAGVGAGVGVGAGAGAFDTL
ncbi:GD16094 [Drosophila simulans]|uniref:GD16094 n=1 Tax=Drosophila simulans TaxID=7240 RepID=B4R6R9_DROSI|nr:GD16094 [Drosophila simulans]